MKRRILSLAPLFLLLGGMLMVGCCDGSHLSAIIPGGTSAPSSPEPAAVQTSTPQEALVVPLLPGSTLRLHGTATIGQWDCTSEQVDGSVRVSAPAPNVNQYVAQITQRLRDPSRQSAPLALQAAAPDAVEGQLAVPVRSLRSGNAAMERDMYNALKADKFPMVRYTLTGIAAATASLPKDRGTAQFQVELEGNLELAGTQRSVRMLSRITPLVDGKYRIVGAKRVRMTDFGVKPPTALFGLIEARDEVEVVFDLLVAPNGMLTASAPAR